MVNNNKMMSIKMLLETWFNMEVKLKIYLLFLIVYILSENKEMETWIFLTTLMTCMYDLVIILTF